MIIKIRQKNLDIFSNQILLELTDFFFLVYTNEGNNAKRFNARNYYLPKGIIKNYNVIINWKNCYDQAINSDMKQYEEIRKLATEEGKDYTTGCLLDYDYIKTHYRSIVADLSRQKELDADPKAIQQMEFIGQLKKLDAEDNATDAPGNDQSMFALTIVEKNQTNEIKIFTKKCSNIIKYGKLPRSES